MITELPTVVTRRMAQDPGLRKRVLDGVDAAFREIHARRLAQWAGDNAWDRPSREDSYHIAEREVGELIRALGTLAAWTPEHYDRDRRLVADRQEVVYIQRP